MVSWRSFVETLQCKNLRKIFPHATQKFRHDPAKGDISFKLKATNVESKQSRLSDWGQKNVNLSG